MEVIILILLEVVEAEVVQEDQEVLKVQVQLIKVLLEVLLLMMVEEEVVVLVK